MVKKVIKYTDFDGNERTEAFYFNLTKAELAEMEMSTDGGMAKKLQTIIDSNDAPTIIKCFKDMIFKAYGEKSDDGRTFIKSEEISKKFESTQAYSDFFMELITDAKKAAAFANELIPSDAKNENNVVAINISN